MSLTIVFINMFQHFYYMIKNKNITKLLSSDMMSYNLAKRILIMSIFHKIEYNTAFLVELKPDFKGYKIIQNTVDRYTVAILKDGIIMIDFDNKNFSLTEVKKSLDDHPQYSYSIVKSAGGYHVFITNFYFNLSSINALNVMASFRGSDPLFSFFVFMSGTTNVRICRKESEKITEPVYVLVENYISQRGKKRGVVPKTSIEQVVYSHIKEAEKYSGIIVKDKENFKGILLTKKFTELENVKNSVLDPKLKYSKIKYKITPEIEKMINSGIGVYKLYRNIIKDENLKSPVSLSFNYMPFDFYTEK